VIGDYTQRPFHSGLKHRALDPATWVCQLESWVESSDEAPLSRHTETELKLAIAPDRLDAVTETSVVTRRRSGEAVVGHLRSIYYDTPNRQLVAQRAVLRVRLTPQGPIQTLKVGAGLCRGEWEWPVAGLVPDLSVITEPDARAVMAECASAEWVPVFETRFERRAVLLDHGAIELALDQGEIVGPDGTSDRISEIELELKAGEPADLYRVALELADAVPLWVEPRSKAARGFAMAAQQPPRAVKSERIVLEPTGSVDSAMTAIFGTCFVQFTANVPCVLAGEDPEGIHQARVGLRRLRSALSLFRSLLPASQLDWLQTETRWLAGSLGPARDWDVFISELLAPVCAAFMVHPELHADLLALESAARAQRQRAWEVARDALLSRRHTTFHLQFGAWLEGHGWRSQPVTPTSARLFRPLDEAATVLLNRRHRKARRVGAHFAELPYPSRHVLRIALKKLRYAIDFFRTLYDDRPIGRYLDRLGHFQDSLGRLNDVATAARLAPRLGIDPVAGASLDRAMGVVIGWHGRELAACEQRLIDEWDDFRSAKPFWGRTKRGEPES
jgi:inorganic triphosphatase YgiF